MPLFRSSPKNPKELVQSLRDVLNVLAAAENGSRKAEKVVGVACGPTPGHVTVIPFRLTRKPANCCSR